MHELSERLGRIMDSFGPGKLDVQAFEKSLEGIFQAVWYVYPRLAYTLLDANQLAIGNTTLTRMFITLFKSSNGSSRTRSIYTLTNRVFGPVL